MERNGAPNLWEIACKAYQDLRIFVMSPKPLISAGGGSPQNSEPQFVCEVHSIGKFLEKKPERACPGKKNLAYLNFSLPKRNTLYEQL